MRDLIINGSVGAVERKVDVITGLLSFRNLLCGLHSIRLSVLLLIGSRLIRASIIRSSYVSDAEDQRVREMTGEGVWLRDFMMPYNATPGALAIEPSGRMLWVNLPNASAVAQVDLSTGEVVASLSLGTRAVPSALFFDETTSSLLVGDQGPRMQIRVFKVTSGVRTPAQVTAETAAIGVTGGYLNTDAGAIKGSVGPHRFTRVVGISITKPDGALFVLNNPFGGTWDLGRNGGTDLHAYANIDPTATMRWQAQSVNFEAVAATSDGTRFDSGNIVFNFTGSGGAGYVANSVDAISYPHDPRLDTTDQSRGEQFGMIATVGGHRILAACGQNPDHFYFSYFTPDSGYTSVPLDSLPGGAVFNTTDRVRAGFFLDPQSGDVWAGLTRPHTNGTISHFALGGFNANTHAPWWVLPPVETPIPASVVPLGRLEYLSRTDTMVLAQALPSDWTTPAGRVEVYHGWKAGNTRVPSLTFNITATNPKALAIAGNYLFVACLLQSTCIAALSPSLFVCVCVCFAYFICSVSSEQVCAHRTQHRRF